MKATTTLSGLDPAYALSEQLPNAFTAKFVDDGRAVWLSIDGRAVGNRLTDACRVRDGYRFHDAMHLAFAVQLGWSPVLRDMLGCKRRSDPEFDECEDGGRACMIEESVCHLIHVHNRDFGNAAWDQTIDLIRRMVRGFESEQFLAQHWIESIKIGLSVQEELRCGRGGLVHGDRSKGILTVVKDED